MGSFKKRVCILLVLCSLLAVCGIPSVPVARAQSREDLYKSIWAKKDTFAVISSDVDPDFVWDGEDDVNLGWGIPWEDANVRVFPNYDDVYEVYSVAQLRYALEIEDKVGDKLKTPKSIKIMSDLDFGGHNWKPVAMREGVSLHLEGNNHVLYNLYSYTVFEDKEEGRGFVDASFLRDLYAEKGEYHRIQNLTFKNIKCEAASSRGDFVERGAATPFAGFSRGELINIGVEDGWFVAAERWAYGMAFLQRNTTWPKDPSGPVTIRDCYTKNVVCYAKGQNDTLSCATAFVGGGANFDAEYQQGALIENCYAIDSTVIALKGHSGGFATCNSGHMRYKNCFSDVTVYAEHSTGAFQGPMHAGDYAFENCYSMGSVDGEKVVGGFVAAFALEEGKWIEDHKVKAEFNRCYSTAIVGMMHNSTNVGSFMGSTHYEDGSRFNYAESLKFTDCYAVGETGGIAAGTADPKKPQAEHLSVGGFIGKDYSDVPGIDFPSINVNYINVYYDKQTTGMRMWATGRKTNYYAEDPGPEGQIGVRGVLTTETKKSGWGLASGTPPESTTSSEGFMGFSGTGLWHYQEGRYPELNVFRNPDPNHWGDRADVVRAYSDASVSTVFLNTWDDPKIAKETYDTVRDLTLSYPYTSAPHLNWRRVANPYSGKGLEEETIAYSIEKIGDTYYGIDLRPGINWSEVTSTIGNGTGRKRLRIIPTASLDAGPDNVWYVGETKSHDAQVHMKYSTPVRMATEEDDITEGGYRNGDQPHAYLKSDTSHMSYFYNTTNLDTSSNAYESYIDTVGMRIDQVAPTTNKIEKTDLRLGVAPDADGWNLVFAGKEAVDPKHVGDYVFDYKWHLKDGRYLQDCKRIRIKKRATATLEVRNRSDTLINGMMILNLAQKAPDAFAFDDNAGTAAQIKTENIPAGTQEIFAWKAHAEDVEVEKIKIAIGAFSTTIEDPRSGSSFTQTVSGYRNLQMVVREQDGGGKVEEYYLTPVTDSIERTIRSQGDALLIAFLGKEIVDGREILDFEDDVTITIYVDAEDLVLNLHIRQRILGSTMGITTPLFGYYQLHNVNPASPDIYAQSQGLNVF